MIIEWQIIVRNDNQDIVKDTKTVLQEEPSVLLTLLQSGALSRMLQERMNLLARELAPNQEPA